MSERTAGVAGGARSPEATRAALEEERAFLIRSLRDLDAERDAGDIDGADYEALRDDYTVRAAALVRRLDAVEREAAGDLVDGDGAAGGDPAGEGAGSGSAVGDDAAGDNAAGDGGGGGADDRATGDVGDHPAGQKAGRRGRRRPWTRWQLAVAGGIVVALAALGGWEVGHGSSGGGGSLSESQVEKMLQRAESEVGTNPVGAIQEYNQILKTYPDQPQALTEVGWIYAQAGQLADAQASLEHAESVEPSYDPAHGYLGVVYFGEDNYRGAVTQLSYYLAHGPDPSLVSQARQALAAAQKDLAATSKPSSPSTTTGR